MKVYSSLPLLLTFFFSSLAHGFLVDKIDAIVNNEVILKSDVSRFEQTLPLRKELDPLFGFNEELAGGKITQNLMIDFLIQEKLISQSFKVTDNEVEQEILGVQRNSHLTHEGLIQFLKSKGFTYEEYFELMQIGLQKRNLLDREIRNRVTITDDDVRNYFYNLAVKEATIPLEYNLQLIMVSQRSYRDPQKALEVAKQALQAIKHGELFSEVAKRVSDDPSGPSGGDFGSITSEQLKEPLKSALPKLQIGGVSDLLKGRNEYFIVKLLDVHSTQSDRFESMKEKIREELAKKEFQKQLVLWAERSKNDAYVHIN